MSDSLSGSRSRSVLRRVAWLLLVCALLVAALPGDTFQGKAYARLAIDQAIGDRGYGFLAWGAATFRQKIADTVEQPEARLTPSARHDLVVSYFDAIGQADALQGRIDLLNSEPHESGVAMAAAATLQYQLDRLREQQAGRRPAVERILQEQVTSLIAQNGLTTAGRVWPPVLFHFTDTPDVLIVSPRDRIFLEYSAYMQPGATDAAMDATEDLVAQRLGVSVLIDGTGGFSTWPTMILALDDMPWVLSTISHEWFHTYMAFHPLGWHYFDNADTRTLNETAADIFGDDLGAQVLAEYYPEKVPRPPQAPGPAGQASRGATPAPFSFDDTMHTTRLKVDALLAQGKIAEAEAYMEAQRQVIVSHGYALRKLNQAYFAFHGSYAEGPAATDPIGPKLRALRAHSGSLRRFVQLVSQVTSVADLDRALASLP
jgi:hypothetical protein